jgi:integrase
MVVLFVQGKGKSRKLVAPASVGTYLDRIRDISKAKELDDPVFTTIDGTPTGSLYKRLIDDLLTKAGLRIGPCGTIRSTYSFRHTYATFRLSEGTDVYFLAEQMGTSVKMIEDHYGHVNTIKHADRVLQGMNGWEAMHAEAEAEPQVGKAKEADAKGAQAAKMRQPSPRSRGKKSP